MKRKFTLTLHFLLFFLFLSCISNSDSQFEGGLGTEENPYQVASAEQLQRIGDEENLDKHFIQVKDIDATETSDFNDGKGFLPIGNIGNPFRGSYNGNDFTISGLVLDYNEPHMGLFGYVKNSLIENIVLINSDDTNCSFEKLRTKALKQTGNMNASYDVNILNDDIGAAGWLVGYNDEGTIRSSSSTGYFSGEGIRFVGGLVGYNTGLIENSHTTSHSSSLDAITGGFVGGNTGLIRDSYATGCAASSGTAGGFVGYNDGGEILNSYATGDTFANSITGGLVAFNLAGGKIKASFSSGKMMGVGSAAGGLAGINHGKIEDSYTIKNFSEFTQATEVGGIVGINKTDGTIITSYSAGKLASEPGSTIGGVAGLNEGVIESSYWDMTATGVNIGAGYGNADGMMGLPTDQLIGPTAQENMSGFDWLNVWTITSDGYPVLRWQEEEN
ncbi:GLUG motif-containing protein [Rhodohalobacter sp. 614A]|uniref:GLUG motif-containing protein n=1 Tax=Rhodohalobacter sp. 614A TaxID=2908649 RepID=UPI001F322FD3|nr:GLUG motif-containing protein [Rhodohalobacter sp. 614A]